MLFRSLIVNPEAAARHGVAFSDEILATHDQAHEYPEVPVKPFAKLLSYKSEFEMNLNSAITIQARNSKRVIYFPQLITGRIFDDEIQDSQLEFALNHSEVQLYYCMGKQLSHKLLEKMHEHNKHFPIVRTMTALERDEDVGPMPKAVKPVADIVLPDPDALMPLKLLLLVKPDIKKVAFLCNIPEAKLPPRIADRLAKIQIGRAHV